MTAPHQGEGTVTVRGRVRSVQIHTEVRGGQGNTGVSSTQVFHFRVEPDDDPDRLVQVRLRPWRVTTQLAEGDEVVVTGTLKNGVLRATEVQNVTTGPSMKGFVVGKGCLVAAMAVFVVAVLAAGLFALNAAGDRDDDGRSVPEVPAGFPGVTGGGSDPGAGQVSVPDVARLPEAEAVSRLRAAGLNPQVMPWMDASVPRGQVVETNPPAGTRVPRGWSVAVLVSS